MSRAWLTGAANRYRVWGALQTLGATASAFEVADHLGMHERTAANHLNRLNCWEGSYSKNTAIKEAPPNLVEMIKGVQA